MYRLSIVLCVVALLEGLAYAKPAVAYQPGEVSLLYPKAMQIYSGSQDQFTYHVEIAYPASAVETWISEGLAKAGWRRLPYDVLNPSLPADVAHGWKEFKDGTRSPERCIHQEIQDWQDKSGNVVRCGFRYESITCDTSKLTDLLVAVVYMPHARSSCKGQESKQTAGPK